MPDLLVAAGPQAATQWPAWWRVVSEVGFFAGLAAAIGGSLTYVLVVRPALRAHDSAADVAAVRQRAALLCRCAAPVLLVAGYLQLGARVARAEPGMSYGRALLPSRIWTFLMRAAEPGAWASSSALVLVQNALFLVVVAAFLGARRHLDSLVPIAASTAIIGAGVNAIPTNIRSATIDDWLDSGMIVAHIVAACSWLGGLAGLALLAMARRSLGERGGLCWARIWQRFSILALVAVGVIVVSGCWLTWKHVGGVAEFVTTAYGRFLLVKVCLVGVLISAGAYNQLFLTPRIVRAHATGELGQGIVLTLRRFPGVVAVEAVLGLCVLVVVPFLSGSARAQAGDDPAPTMNTGILVLGTVFVLGLAATLYMAHRVSLMLRRQAGQGLSEPMRTADARGGPCPQAGSR